MRTCENRIRKKIRTRACGTKQTIWVTRTAPDNTVTLEWLSQNGLDAVGVPVLETLRLQAPTPEIRPDVIVFTSVNGVRHHPADAALCNLPTYAVGDRTADAARSAGFRDVISAAGDVSDLEKLILRSVKSESLLFHFSALLPAGDLARNLTSSGLSVLRLAVYETRRVSHERLCGDLPSLEELDGIVLHSPRAALSVAEYLDRSSTPFAGTVFCISQAAAQPLDHLQRANVRVAERPDESSIRKLIASDAASI